MMPEQMRAARELLGLSVAAFAEIADVSESTIVDFEAGRPTVPLSVVETMHVALEAAGVAFKAGGVGLKASS